MLANEFHFATYANLNKKNVCTQKHRPLKNKNTHYQTNHHLKRGKGGLSHKESIVQYPYQVLFRYVRMR